MRVGLCRVALWLSMRERFEEEEGIWEREEEQGRIISQGKKGGLAEHFFVFVLFFGLSGGIKFEEEESRSH